MHLLETCQHTRGSSRHSFLNSQDPRIHTTIDDAFSSVLQYMCATSRQCRVSYYSHDNFGSADVMDRNLSIIVFGLVYLLKVNNCTGIRRSCLKIYKYKVLEYI